MGARKPNNFMQGQGPLKSFQNPEAPSAPSGIFSGLDAGPTAAQDMRATGESQMQTARQILDDPMLSTYPGRKELRADTREDFREGRKLRKAGMLAGRLQNIQDRRAEMEAAGKDTSRLDRASDRVMGNVIRRFGSDDANELAGKMGDTRHMSKDAPKKDMSDFQQYKHEARLGRLMEKRDAAREAAGGMNYKQIEGKGLKAEQRRAAALVARKKNQQINQMLGKAGKRFGTDKAAELAENTGLNQRRA